VVKDFLEDDDEDDSTVPNVDTVDHNMSSNRPEEIIQLVLFASPNFRFDWFQSETFSRNTIPTFSV
jgi:hypothetical protein